jgi:hypothetical protein
MCSGDRTSDYAATNSNAVSGHRVNQADLLIHIKSTLAETVYIRNNEWEIYDDRAPDTAAAENCDVVWHQLTGAGTLLVVGFKTA